MQRGVFWARQWSARAQEQQQVQELQQSGAAAALELGGLAVPAVQGAVRLSCAQTGCGALEAGHRF